VVDAGEFEEYRAEYARRSSAATPRIGGGPSAWWPNQKKNVQTSQRLDPEAYRDLVESDYTESATKAARFILDCNQKQGSLIFCTDVNGLMVGKGREWPRHHPRGSKVVNAG